MEDLDLDDELLRLAGIEDTNLSKGYQQIEDKYGQQGNSDGNNKINNDNYQEDIDFDNLQAMPPQKKFKYQPSKLKQNQKINESDEDNDDSELDFGQNPDDDQFYDDDDKKKLMKLPEFEREMILQERAEKLEEERGRTRLLDQTKDRAPQQKEKSRLLKTAIKQKPYDQKKKAIEEQEGRRSDEGSDDGEIEDNEDLSNKQQIQDELNEKGQVENQDEDDEDWDNNNLGRSVAKGKSSMAYQSRAGSIEDDMDMDMDMEEQQKVVQEAQLEQVQSIQIKRSQLEKWVDEPFFNRCIPGAVVRMAGNENNSSAQQTSHHNSNYNSIQNLSQYMMGVVQEISENKEKQYSFGPKVQKTFKYLSIDFGSGQPKVVEMGLISNKDITDTEFYAWHDIRNSNKLSQISSQDFEQVNKQLKEANNYKYTSEDIRKRVEERRSKGILNSNPAIEKARLMRLKEYYAQRNDDIKLVEINQQLAIVESTLDKNKQMYGQKHSFANNPNHLQRGFNQVLLMDKGEKDTSRRKSTLTNSYFKTGNRQKEEPQAQVVITQKGDNKPQQIKNIGQLMVDMDLTIDLDLISQKKRFPQIIKSLLGNQPKLPNDSPTSKKPLRIYTIQEYIQYIQDPDVLQG